MASEKEVALTDADFESAPNQLSDSDFSTQEDSSSQNPTALERVFDIPSAAIRSFLQGKGYIEGAVNYKDVPKFQDIALEKVNKAIDKTPISKLDETGQTIVRSALGMPVSAIGLASDMATNPADVIMALSGKAPGAAKVGELISESLPGRIMRNAMTSEIHSPIKLGGVKSIEHLAFDMKKSLNSMYASFNNQYESMFKTIGNKYLPKESVSSIETAIDSSIRKISPESPIFNYLSKVKERLSGITGPELHALKQELFYRGKPVKGTMGYEMNEVYNSMSDALSHPKVYGAKYKELSSSYGRFKQNIANYVEDNILDKFGKISPSSSLTSPKVPDRQLLNAIKRLGSNVGRDYVTTLNQLKRGIGVVKTIERYGPAIAVGAGGVGAAYGVGRAIANNSR